MYCKMLGVGNGAILKKKNVWKSLVELISANLVPISIFSIHLRLIIISLNFTNRDGGEWREIRDFYRYLDPDVPVNQSLTIYTGNCII